MSEKKIAVFFPGIGYTCEKPLLYYSKKIALSLGYEVKDVPYTGFETGIKEDREKMVEAFKHALSFAEEELCDINWGEYNDILFVSKSIGTTVAAVYAKKYHLNTKNIYFTPINETIEFGIERGIVFHGSGDPWADTEIIREGCSKEGIIFHVIKDANHSMETEDVFDNMETLSGIMWQVQEYIKA